jgi:FMN phosphatase YigB (HAD superfamily)
MLRGHRLRRPTAAAAGVRRGRYSVTMKPRVTTIVTDLDNTLYDWLTMWGAAFGAMVRALAERSGLPREIIEADARGVHQRRGTTEYAFLIQELPCLREKHPRQDLARIYADAIAAYRLARERSLELFPSVAETLAALKARGCLVVGYTDSRAFHAGYRVRRLGLDGLLDYLYSPPDHALPSAAILGAIRSRPEEAYRLGRTVHRVLPEGEVKPNPAVLASIMEDVGAAPERTIHVGDSLLRDVLMAQQAGVTDVFARYGLAQHRQEYELLRRVSHWTDADIERERRRTAQQDIHPSYTLDEALGELLDLFEFEPFAA